MSIIIRNLFLSVFFRSALTTEISHASAGKVCKTTNDCISELLLCDNGVCMCNPLRAHLVFEYLSIETQKSVMCQSLNAGRKCRHVYYRSRECSCSPREVAFILAGVESGFCTSNANAWGEFNSYCSSLKSACNVSQLLMCQNNKCTCSSSTYYFNSSLPGCVSNENYVPLFGHFCSAVLSCSKDFECINGKCQCPADCGPYLENESICACNRNKGWRLLIFKVLPLIGFAIILLVLAVSVGYMVSSRRSKLYQQQAETGLLSDTNVNTRRDTTIPTAPVLIETADYGASAPPPPDEDAPPTYEESMLQYGQ